MPGLLLVSSFPSGAPQARQPGIFAPGSLPRRLSASLLDLIFPPSCAGCGRVDCRWCDRCQTDLEQIPPPQVVRPLPPLSGMASTAVHEGKVQQAIWSLKYENAPYLSQPLGDRLANHLRRLDWPVSCVVPVPMHAHRLAERGYNQAQLLAERAARQAALTCRPDALRRWRFTPSQVGLGREARLENVKDAFEADPALIGGQSVLLVDDVYTTGATLSACAAALLEAGAAAVYGLTVSAARH
ncbi:MAG: ComF family protein [Chloroflexi bacterium]|nr:ComF family protein [Chloroflexota bacterium]